MKKTNFDRYLDRQLRDPAFAARFKRAGEAWDERSLGSGPKAKGPFPPPSCAAVWG